jgi:hypothetical protein
MNRGCVRRHADPLSIFVDPGVEQTLSLGVLLSSFDYFCLEYARGDGGKES